MSDGVRGALIGAVAAIAGIVVGTFGGYLSQRALERADSGDAARAVARIIAADYQVRSKEIRTDLDSSDAGLPYSLGERRQLLKPLQLTFDDRKLIAARASIAQWQAIVQAEDYLTTAWTESAQSRARSTRERQRAMDGWINGADTVLDPATKAARELATQ